MLKRFLLIRGIEGLVVLLLAAIPLMVDNSFMLGLLTLLAIYGILLIGLDVTVGYLGQVNLAQAAFLGLGAYTAGLLVNNFEFGMVSALAAATLAGLVMGGLLAFPALRLEGPQFALATLSFSALSATVLNEWESLTQGALGLQIVRPSLFGITLDAKGFYWLCLFLMALVWIAMKNLLFSQWGRAFEALRDSPIATDAMGIGAYRHKVAGFALSSGLGGLAGGLYAFNFEYLQPSVFVYDLMVILLLGVVLGGRKNLWGAFVGSILIVLLPNLLSSRILFQIFSVIGFLFALGAGGLALYQKRTRPFQGIAPMLAMGLLVIGSFTVQNTEDWRKAIFALMLFSVVVGLPEGVMGFAAKFLSKLFRLDPLPLAPASGLEQVLVKQAVDGSPILQLQELKCYFGGVKAVDGVSLTVASGTIHGLIGPNGSGKSTLVNVVSGLYSPTGGSILFQGKPLVRGNLFDVARQGISRTFQNLQLFTGLSALDNVMVSMKGYYSSPLPLVLFGLTGKIEKKAESDALALLEMVGLADQARTPSKDLPYGAQRFLEIARAVARRPAFLILDEPAAGLAHPDVAVLLGIIRRINRQGITIILIEHHMDVVAELCDIVTVLDGGKVIAAGLPDQIRRNPLVIEAYLGKGSETASPATGCPAMSVPVPA